MFRRRILIAGATSVFLSAASVASIDAAEKGFDTLFDGSNLDRWTLVNKKGPGYVIEEGVLVCPREGGGNLFTKKEYANFVLRLDFKVEPGGNNGIGLRTPMKGNPAYAGMEIQVLDDYAEQYAKLKPTQYCGSIYDLFPVKRGALKKAGQWNSEEIRCDGRRVTIKLNGKVVVDANLDDITDEEKKRQHPGLSRKDGHIGFLGHGTRVEFRNVRIKELP